MHYVCVFRMIGVFFCMIDALCSALFVHAGVWKAWFLRMLRGEMLPVMPVVPPEFHKHAGETVPYTLEEMEIRNEQYNIKKATWDKTMKV
jgi:hypothetical protein